MLNKIFIVFLSVMLLACSVGVNLFTHICYSENHAELSFLKQLNCNHQSCCSESIPNKQFDNDSISCCVDNHSHLFLLPFQIVSLFQFRYFPLALNIVSLVYICFLIVIIVTHTDKVRILFKRRCIPLYIQFNQRKVFHSDIVISASGL